MRVIYCIDCGKDIWITGKQSRRIRCEECDHEKRKERQRERYARERLLAPKEAKPKRVFKVVSADSFPAGTRWDENVLKRNWLKPGYFDDAAILESDDGERYRVVREKGSGKQTLEIVR